MYLLPQLQDTMFKRKSCGEMTNKLKGYIVFTDPSEETEEDKAFMTMLQKHGGLVIANSTRTLNTLTDGQYRRETRSATSRLRHKNRSPEQVEKMKNYYKDPEVKSRRREKAQSEEAKKRRREALQVKSLLARKASLEEKRLALKEIQERNRKMSVNSGDEKSSE